MEGDTPELCAHSPRGEGCGAAAPLSVYGCQPQLALRPHSPAPCAHRRRRSQAVGAAAATVVVDHRRESAADCPSAGSLPTAAAPPPQRAPLIPRHRAPRRCDPLAVGGGGRRRRGRAGAAGGPLIRRRPRSMPTTAAAAQHHAPLAPRSSRRPRRLSSFSMRPQPEHISGARGGARVPAAQRSADAREAREAIGHLAPQPLLVVQGGGMGEFGQVPEHKS